MKNFVEVMRRRGMLHDVMPGTEEALNKGVTAAYIGFDPTAASLHIGNLATLMLLVHFQQCGHKPIAVVGGATGMVGDPSGKSAERNLLDEPTLRANQEGVRKQLERFLDFDPAKENAAEVTNNYDWFKHFGFLNFLREVGKHLSINYMLSKDSVKNRLETGISFTEFSYQLLQGYDFYHLRKTKNCLLQMGGSDQWGNITTGTELIRRMGEGEAYALTCPLITKPDGSKFGKSEGGNVWLDADLTSPYKFYQFWLNTADSEAPRLIRVFTTLELEVIESLEAEHAEAPHLRLLQKQLASDVTIRVHGREAYEKAVAASEILFGKSGPEELAELDEQTLLDLFEGVPQVTVPATDLNAEIVSFLTSETQGQILTGKGETRKLIASGAITINGIKVELHESDLITARSFGLLKEKYLLVKKGKKNYYLIVVV